MIFGVTRRKDLDAVIISKPRLGRRKRLPAVFFAADAGHDAETLRLDIDLTFFVQVASYRTFERVVGSQEPFAVPAVLKHCIFHVVDRPEDFVCLIAEADPAHKFRVFSAVFDEHAGDEDAFRFPALEVGNGLEAFSGFVGEAVEV